MNLRQTFLPLALTLFPAAAAAQTPPSETPVAAPTVTPPPSADSGTPHPMTPPQSGTASSGNFTQSTWGVGISSFLLPRGGFGFSFDNASTSLPSTTEIASTLCISRSRAANFTLFGNVNGRGVNFCGLYADNLSGSQRAGAVAQVTLMGLLDEAVFVRAGLEGGVLMRDFMPVGGYLGAIITVDASLGGVFHAPILKPLYGSLMIPVTLALDYVNNTTGSVTIGLGVGLTLRVN